MITGDLPQTVADIVGKSADDITLMTYLHKKGFKTTIFIDGGNEKTDYGFVPSDDDFEAIKKVIDSGNIVFYHFAGWDKKSSGHYTILKDYDDDGFFFYDPAGDRSQGYFNAYGQDAHYTVDELKKAGIKRLWAISEEE